MNVGAGGAVLVILLTYLTLPAAADDRVSESFIVNVFDELNAHDSTVKYIHGVRTSLLVSLMFFGGDCCMILDFYEYL